MTRITRILAWLLTRGRRPVLAGMAALTLALALCAAGLGVEPDTRSMVASQPDQEADYARFRDRFGNDEDLLLSVTHPRLLEPDGLALLDELTGRIGAIDGVRQVLSLANARRLRSGAYGAEDAPLLPAASRSGATAEALRAALDGNPQYRGLLFSADRRTAGVLIVLDDRRDDALQRRRLIGAVRALMTEYAGRAELHLTGVGAQKIAVSDYIQRDQRVILPLVALILAGMLAVIFRRLSGVLLPLLATLVSLVWTMGLYALCGQQLNTITALLPPVVMVLAISNSIHLYNGWLQLEGADEGRIARLAARAGELFTPCLFTALTTALGLVSLTVSAVPAVRQFALFAALGVMLSLLVSMTLVPIGLSALPQAVGHARRGSGLLRRSLEGIARLSVSAPRAIMLTAGALLLVALLGLPLLKNNTNLVGFLREDAPLAVDTAYIDRHLAGVGTLEFMIARADGHPLDTLDDYRRLAAVEALARDRSEVANVYSILDLLRQLHRAETGGEALGLPGDRDTLRYELELMAMAPDRSLEGRFLTADRTAARLSVWLHDVGSERANALVDALVAEGRQALGPAYRLVPTGSFYQVTRDSNRLVDDLLKSLALSLTLVMLAILALVRSLRLALVAMIPNIIPIVWTFGLMGFCGIDLSTGTAMIGAVVIGLAVDDTIHYLVHYRRVYAGDAAQAVIETTTRTGRALAIASLVLAFGFWAGCLGSFKPTVYFSFLVGGTLLGALACDLLVLPACLVLSSGRREGVS